LEENENQYVIDGCSEGEKGRGVMCVSISVSTCS
jgi:hypothetical protein